MPAKKLCLRHRQRVVDRAAYAAIDAALAEGRTRFGPPLKAVGAEINALVAGRKLAELSGAETVRFMALRVEFNSLSIQQKHLIAAVCAECLGIRHESK
ncbi:hypothetical protein JMJ56_29180 [Belnapia sp. T18]|uniref:Uncharacterized protein n=1 Tax=Belnapia arida TaxID=2804533 RepID=A0ABS1UBI6_9PROT|nr:hypothetical protein [Belnapia arida]MBL6082055.1 hypothetical protein [Belnapia arida]